jgi:Ca2+-binding RTX toxin-like protein
MTVATGARGMGNTVTGKGGSDPPRGAGGDTVSGGAWQDTLQGGAGADTLLGEENADVFVAGGGDVVDGGITRAPRASTDYIHIMCDRHEVIMSDGIWTESFQPGDQTLAGMDATQRFELETIFPHLVPGAAGFAAVRMTLRRYEADLLLA